MVQKAAIRKIGLARALSKLGYSSRSRSAELIRRGRVQLNGVVQRDPEAPVNLARDRILIEGRPVARQPSLYLMMNKPRGLITTAADEKSRATVYSLLVDRPEIPWVAPVGRLDKASEGLLLLTNDSEWGARIAAPDSHVEKTYHVQIGTVADEKTLAALTRGVQSGEGNLLRVLRARILRAGEKNCWLEVVLDEGKNRHIRRMLQALGIEVLRLVRVAIGPLQLGQLPKGNYRSLTLEEKKSIDYAMRGVKTHNPQPGSRRSD